jgi:nitrate reductase NapD
MGDRAAEVHIASCVAYVKPESMGRVIGAIGSTGLAEVPRHDERGRIVVLIERSSAGQVMEVIDAIRALDGVLAVNLAYQHAEPEADLQEPQ